MGSKDQLAVWHGQQMTSPLCDTVRQRNVFLYPTEYLTNGIGWNGVHEDITPIITRPDGSKEYRISDHLASLRVSLTSGTPTKYYDYDPWGGLLGGTTPPRRGFNDNEKDKENGLFSLGVRKYEEGRFLSIDVLFESEPEISPYVYCGNAPMNYVDPEGKQRKETNNPQGYSGMQTGVDKPGATGINFPKPALGAQQWGEILTQAEMVAFATGMSTGQVLDTWFNGAVESSAAEALPDLYSRALRLRNFTSVRPCRYSPSRVTFSQTESTRV